jgi:hypothetical protein
LASVSIGEIEMTRFKTLSAGLIAVAMLATPVMAREHHRHFTRNDDAAATYGDFNGRDCVRAPNVGAYASDPYTQPPCEPASMYWMY